MTYAQARNAVRGTLHFGDDYQIRALNFLADVAEIQERIEAAPECQHCDGYGVTGSYCGCVYDCGFVEWTRCKWCHGTGHLTGDVDFEACRGNATALHEAIEELYLRNYRQKRAR